MSITNTRDIIKNEGGFSMQILPVNTSSYLIQNKQNPKNTKNNDFDVYVSQAENTATINKSETTEPQNMGLLKSLFRHSSGNVITLMI